MASEKPTATTAATTAFCADKIEAFGKHLWIDGNGKITAGNGTLDAPRPNAFSLIEIADCPGSTAVCRTSCYVHGLRKHAPDTHALYVHNSETLRDILENDWPAWGWVREFATYINAHCRGGFRWHVSGDVFSRKYAVFISRVVTATDPVPHWIYTRSFQDEEIIAELVGIDNLVVNLSADRENYAAARQVAERHRLRVCYMTTDGIVPNTLQPGDVIFPDYNLRGGNFAGQDWFGALPSRYKAMVCPVDYHGKAENRRCGPCDRCMKQRGPSVDALGGPLGFAGHE